MYTDLKRDSFLRTLLMVLCVTVLMGDLVQAESVAAPDLVDATREIKPCVVLLEVETSRSRSYSTGFIVSADGHIIANEHSVRDAQSVTVYYLNKEEYPAKIIKTRFQDDLALLKITSSEKFPTVRFGKDQTDHGVPVGVTGYPLPPTLIQLGFALDSSSSFGITSGQRQTDGGAKISRVVTQIDAVVAMGNSGSPVYTADGKVVGVVVATIGDDALKFAAPVSRVKSLLVDCGVVPNQNPVGSEILVPPGDLSILNTIPGNKILHPLFGKQKTARIDPSPVIEWLYVRSYHIFQVAVGRGSSRTTPPVAVGNNIQFGTLDGTLYEYDTTFQELRNVAQADHPYFFKPVSDGQRVFSASGYLSSDSDVSLGIVKIHKVKGQGQLMSILPSTGSVEWVVSSGFLSELSVTDQYIYAGSLGALTAYDVTDGGELWKVKKEGPGGDTHWFSPAESNGELVACLVVPVRVEDSANLLGRATAYVACYDGATGAQKWKSDLQIQNSWPHPLAGTAVSDLHKDRLFVVHADTIYAYQLSNGKKLWARPFTTRPNPKDNDKNKVGPYFYPGITVSGDTLYVGCEDKNLYAISANTGEQIWVRGTNGRVGLATVDAGQIYVGATDNFLYALDAKSGALLWKYNCKAVVSGAPIVMGKRLYCTTDNGLFHTIRIPR